MAKKFIIGLDEAGRGPLAGPIVAAAVLSRGLKKEQSILSSVKDSKKLLASQRETLFLQIIKNFVWSVQLLDNIFIDRYGIQAANRLVMAEALEELQSLHPAVKITIVSDYVAGFKHPGVTFHQHGEDKFPVIAAASIVAKVWRDKLMVAVSEHYSDYNFSQHKGYGTEEHFKMLKKFGLTPLHRRSFLRNL
jgi:ribonuclease HII